MTVWNAPYCPVADCNGAHFPNLPLLRKIMDEITANPASWRQNTWVTPGQITTKTKRNERGQFAGVEYVTCGTAYCIAGHAVQMTGYHFAKPQTGFLGIIETVTETTIDHWSRGPAQRQMTIPEVAAHELGLSNEERILFQAELKMTDIKRYCQLIAKRAGEDF